MANRRRSRRYYQKYQGDDGVFRVFISIWLILVLVPFLFFIKAVLPPLVSDLFFYFALIALALNLFEQIACMIEKKKQLSRTTEFIRDAQKRRTIKKQSF